MDKLRVELVNESKTRLHELETQLSKREELDIPVPCTLDGLHSISEEDETLRLVQLTKKYDTKRVKEIVNKEIGSYLAHNTDLFNVPKSVIAQIKTKAKEDDVRFQVPKIVDMMLMFYGNDTLMHSCANVLAFKPYIVKLIDDVVIFTPAYAGVDDDDWSSLLQSSTAGTYDGTNFCATDQINNCEVTLYDNSCNRIKLKSKYQITPHIVYDTWHKVIKQIRETQDEKFERT